MAIFGRYIEREPETQDQVQARVDSMSPRSFKACIMSWMFNGAQHDMQAFYEHDGSMTPNGMMHLALARRIAREENLDSATEERLVVNAQAAEQTRERLGEADVWHAGSESFYHAKLLTRLTPEQALELPPEIAGTDVPVHVPDDGLRGIIREAFIAGFKQRAPFDHRTAEGFTVLEQACAGASLYYARVKSVMPRK